MRSICLMGNIQLGYAIKTIVSQEKDCKKNCIFFLSWQSAMLQGYLPYAHCINSKCKKCKN
jgi:hypothetical protein